jgi:hypothetical protein
MTTNKNNTEIMILGTLHGLHRNNEAYSFDDIFRIIEEFNPDAAGVEIRSEDIDQPKEYLSKYYPYEMIETKFRYSSRIPVYGFDWLGDEIKNGPIPDGYFKTLPAKILESEFDADIIPEKAYLEKLDQDRMLFITNKTAKECNDGRFDASCEEYYAQFAAAFKGTKYQPITDFYRKRDENIGRNIIGIIEQNEGKKIIFLMGMDHRVFAIKNIRARFGEDIKIVAKYSKN